MNMEKRFAQVLKSKNFDSKTVERLFREFVYDYSQSTSSTSCQTCNGYYGPSFGQHLCVTCHSFLYPEDLSLSCASMYFQMKTFDEKSDSEDSGNEDLGPAGTEKSRLSGGEGTPIHSSGNNFSLLRSHSPRTSNKLAEQILALTCPNDLNNHIAAGIFDRFPGEVFTRIFSYLDDMSLWCCSRVCKRWEQIIKVKISSATWEQSLRRRWPLVQPFFAPICWYKLYTKLVECAPCMICLQDMLTNTYVGQRDNSCWRAKRLFSELKVLQTEPPAGVEARALDRERSTWLASLTGPPGSPYEGGKFYILIQVPETYPMTPPIMRFLTKIFHPNVNRHGDIGLDVLLNNWSLALTMGKLLLSIQSLLTDPNSEICMEPKIGKLYKDNRTAFDLIAQLWTAKFAMVEFQL